MMSTDQKIAQKIPALSVTSKLKQVWTKTLAFVLMKQLRKKTVFVEIAVIFINFVLFSFISIRNLLRFFSKNSYIVLLFLKPFISLNNICLCYFRMSKHTLQWKNLPRLLLFSNLHSIWSWEMWMQTFRWRKQNWYT